MISGAIANGSIKIALEGFAKVQQQMNTLRIQGDLAISTVGKAGKAASEAGKEAATGAAKADSAFKNLNKTILTLSGAFAVSTVAIRSFAGAADPRGALELELAFTRLQIAIGRNFIPILREAGTRINQVAAYLNSLSNETREAVLHWSKLGLAVGGGAAGLAAVGGVGGKVVGGLAPLAGVLSSVAGWFWRILGFLGPWGRIIVIVGSLAAALFTANNASKDLSGTMGKLASVAKQVWDTIKSVWGQLVAVVGPVVSQVEDLLEGLGETIVGGLGKAWEELAPLFTKGVGGIVPLLSAALAGVVPVVTVLVNNFKTLFNSLLPVGIAVAKYYATTWGRIFGTIGKFVSALEPTITKLTNTFAKLFSNNEGAEKFQSIFGSIAGFIDGMTAEVSKLFDKLDAGAQAFADVINGLFDDTEENPFAGILDDLKPVLNLLNDVHEAALKAFAGLSEQVKPVVDAVRSLFAGSGGNPFGGLAEGLKPVLNYLSAIGSLAVKIFNGAKEVWAAVFVALFAQIEKLQPQFEKIGEVVKTVFGFAAEQGQKFNNALAGIASRVGPPLLALFERIGTAIGLVYNLAAALVRVVGNELSAAYTKLAAVAGPVIDWIGNKVAAAIDKLVAAFYLLWEPVKAVISKIGEAFLQLGYTIEHYLTWAINKAIDVLNGFIEKLQAALKIANKLNPGEDITINTIARAEKTSDEQKKKSFEDLRKFNNAELGELKQPAKGVQGQIIVPPPEAKKEPENNPNKFQGQSAANPRFIGIAEAMRAAQQSTVPTKESVQLQEINRQLGQQNQNLEAIKENTGKQPNMGLAR